MDSELHRFPRAREILAKARGTAPCLVSTASVPHAPWLGGMSAKSLTDDSWKGLPSRGRRHEQPARPQESPRTTSRRPGILVVDDDIAVRNLLKEMLWQHGFIVWLAGTGQQALELYQELHAHIDLVLLDVRMPGLDGPRTLVGLQRLNPDIQCCFMSADPGEYTEEELLDRGAVRILQKPLHLPEVACYLWDLVSPSETGEGWSEAQGRTEESMPELFLG